MLNIKSLRWIRRVFAAIFLLLFAFAFIDFSNTLSPEFLKGLLYFQFTPSVLKFIKVGGILATGFIAVIVLTLLFGRVYCSFLCPLGIFQDLVARFRIKKPRYKFLKPWNIIRYTTLVVVIVAALAGSLFLLYTLDPYSFAGRIFSDLIRPIYYGVNNLLVKILGFFNSYALHQVEFKGMPWQGVAITGGLTLALSFAAWKWGRIFCNSFCPVGAFLSLISRYSIFKLVIDESACTACNRCSRDCKATCIDVKSKKIDFSRCVACFNCVDSCKEGGIVYRLSWPKSKMSSVNETDSSRRGFIATFTGMVIGVSAVGQSIQSYAQGKGLGKGKSRNLSTAGSIPNERSAPITPPGSYNQNEYLNACTACHLCVSVCPTHVIQPSINEFGFWGIMQPHMDFHSGFCNFECTLCGEVCPTGAIRLLDLETKKRVQLGKAKFHKANCIVRVDRTDCGACSEHCPTKAVHMVEWQGLLLPEVDEEICIGCGACEYACPTVPYKAIFVNGNPEHLVADLPKQMDDAPRDSDMEEFPF
jgi:polyferredoxin